MSPHDALVSSVALPALLSQHGEELMYRGEPLIAIVERGVVPEIDASGFTDFLPESGSLVTVAKTELDIPPQKGESFVDEYQKTHRIKDVSELGAYWRCVCQAHDAPET